MLLLVGVCGMTPSEAAGVCGLSAVTRRWLEPAVAIGLGALYLAEAVTRALAV